MKSNLSLGRVGLRCSSARESFLKEVRRLSSERQPVSKEVKAEISLRQRPKHMKRFRGKEELLASGEMNNFSRVGALVSERKCLVL